MDVFSHVNEAIFTYVTVKLKEELWSLSRASTAGVRVGKAWGRVNVSKLVQLVHQGFLLMQLVHQGMPFMSLKKRGSRNSSYTIQEAYERKVTQRKIKHCAPPSISINIGYCTGFCINGSSIKKNPAN